ncbi:hypothetical protein BaRGS_00031856 [Batillaria attramentaria]|uniref:Uncharacterized protein n=1 Tax=Batillaria attramentaria TaxID=370345 RepID=A0ABD0JPY0_9CAEN
MSLPTNGAQFKEALQQKEAQRPVSLTDIFRARTPISSRKTATKRQSQSTISSTCNPQYHHTVHNTNAVNDHTSVHNIIARLSTQPSSHSPRHNTTNTQSGHNPVITYHHTVHNTNAVTDHKVHNIITQSTQPSSHSPQYHQHTVRP